MNLQGKLSGLKGLVSGAQGRRRYKGELTADMIGAPMDDFRHTMHVGRGGDVFGDTSFLSNHGGGGRSQREAADANANAAASSSAPATPDNKIGAFFSRTLRQVRKGSASEGRPSGGGGGGGGGGGARDVSSQPPPAISPIIKNAISLPRLDAVGRPNGGGSTARELFPSPPVSPTSPQEEGRAPYGLDSGFVTLPRLSRAERQQPSLSPPTSCSSASAGAAADSAPRAATGTFVPLGGEPVAATTHSDSLRSLTSLDLTFTLDLGPSLMSEVFGLIDSPDGHSDRPAWEAEEAGSAFGAANDGSEMDSATVSYVDSLLREDCGGEKSPYVGDWEEEEEEEEEGRRVTVMTDLNGGAGQPLRGASPSEDRRARPAAAMESERFRNAADVLAVHYGAACPTAVPGAAFRSEGVSYSDEEEEIKV